MEQPKRLIFFVIFSLALFGSYAIVRQQVKRSAEDLVEEKFPGDVSPFQIAEFLYDKTRALQAATRKEPFAESAFFSILFIAIPVARIVQGLSNRRPVTSLIVELAI